MFAARRKERVIGRTEKLEDSTITRNGFSQDGAPPGRSVAVNFMGRDVMEDKMMLSHRVRPKEKVNRRWLESLKIWGARLIRLKVIRNTNREEIRKFQPRNFWVRELVSWVKMTSSEKKRSQEMWDGFSQMGGIKGQRIRRLSGHIPLGPVGRLWVAICGSNEVKMSANMVVGGGVGNYFYVSISLSQDIPGRG